VTSIASPPSSAASARGRALAYWGVTIVLATGCLAGGLLGALRWPGIAGVARRLGFPPYLMTILGAWYGLAGAALLAPRFPRLKEWAYAGLVFSFTGAAASHLASGDRASALAAPTVLTALTAVSWALRPPSRRLGPASPATADDRATPLALREAA
jgi:DoxX-like family